MADVLAADTEEHFAPALAPVRPGGEGEALAPAVAALSDFLRQSQEHARGALNDFLTPLAASYANLVSPDVRVAPNDIRHVPSHVLTRHLVLLADTAMDAASDCERWR